MAKVVFCTHPPLSPAVQRCCDARNQMIERDRNMPPDQVPDPPTDPKDIAGAIKFKSDTMILMDSLDQNIAYRSCMPEPIGRRNIKNFIACITHGLAIGAIKPNQARNMLYAARAATLAIKYKDREKKKPVVSAPAPAEHEMYLETVKASAI